MGGRFVAQLAVVAGKTELLDQSQLRQQLRLAEDDFGENFLVKQIQTPGPEPDQVDKEDRDANDQNENNDSQPLQGSFKHKSAGFVDAPGKMLQNLANTSLPAADLVDTFD